MTSPSAGAVEGIVNEIVTSDGGDRPVLQVAVPAVGARRHKGGLWLTDGRWVYAMAATQVHASCRRAATSPRVPRKTPQAP